MTLQISRPWARTESADALMGAGFFTVANPDDAHDRLLRASSPKAGKIEIQAIKVVGPGIRMQALEGGLRVPKLTTLVLKPRGYHLLMSELPTPWPLGSKVPVSLEFEKAGRIEVELLVEAHGPIGIEALVDTNEVDAGKP
jgi:copper(I)-binding protein